MNAIGWFDFKRMFDPTRSAVVGNAPSVGSRLGAHIDRCSLVVRFNQARTSGYEEHVGSRTDLLICNLHQFEAPVSPRVEAKAVLALVDYRSRRADVNRLQEWLGEAPVFFSLVPDVLPTLGVRRTRGFTSGTYGLHILLAHFTINELLVTGFNFYKGGTGMVGHYWEKEVVPAPVEHDLGLDKEAFVQMLRGFSGHLEVCDEIILMLADLSNARLKGKVLHRSRSILQMLSGRVGGCLLETGMLLRRWSEA